VLRTYHGMPTHPFARPLVALANYLCRAFAGPSLISINCFYIPRIGSNFSYYFYFKDSIDSDQLDGGEGEFGRSHST